MFDTDKWQEILTTIRKNKLRTFLTAFGVFWGIFILVLLLGVGNGLKNGVKKEFSGSAVNSIWVWGGKTSVPHEGFNNGRVIRFNEEDLQALKARIGAIDLIGPRNRLNGAYNVYYRDKYIPYQVYGVTADYFTLNGDQCAINRLLNQIDILEERKVAVIGKKAADLLFEGGPVIGEYIKINQIFFKIVGVFENEGGNGRNEERIYLPFSTFQKVFNQDNDIEQFGLSAQGVASREMESEVKRFLADRYHFSPEDIQAVGMASNEEKFLQYTGLFHSVKIFVWGVGIGTLIAGIVGVSNIMMIIVRERTKEIGIRKAIGAKPFTIVSLILQESLIITSVAGGMGLLVGTALLNIIRYAIEKSNARLPFFSQPEVDFTVVVIALCVLVISGLLAGLFPALKASSINPVEAMRQK